MIEGKHACLLDMQMTTLEMYTGSPKEDNHKQRCEMTEHHLETLQKKEHLCKKTIELFLDEEEKSLEDERSKEKPKSDGNNTETQKKLGIDINMRGQRRDTGRNQK